MKTCKYCGIILDAETDCEENTFCFCSSDCRELFYGGGWNDRKELDEMFDKQADEEFNWNCVEHGIWG